MKKLLLATLLLTASIANSAQLMATIPNGAIVIRDSFCKLDELVDDFPYEAYVIENNKLLSKGCWKKSNTTSTPMIIFIEKVKDNRYEYNTIESKHFK